ncbi:DUF1624 domain-containing protein [Algoriphagus terrigena]|uniref:DUF1624 domain-containing protein n=1 Tax=Algoriphagus terrigena TaxID=344884 RepID=UPI000479A0DA|nr:heparan-alpha-glucosaminide N-acetyltransferase domain-containing protein [Algoriphagus terrigena]
MKLLARSNRISSIDVLRGLVMLIMLVDHVRERFYLHHQVADPMVVSETEPGLFFTRLSAHLCAPIFVFLTGLAAWLYAHPADGAPRSAKGFLLKRGFFLVFLELTLINLSWFGTYDRLYLQVIWVIGLCMIVLALASNLPRYWIGGIGFLIVLGHNLLDPIAFSPGEFGYGAWTILHDRGFLVQGGALDVKISYPVLPWFGVIFLGYFAGSLFGKKIDVERRTKILLGLGASSLLLLTVLRGFNLYGERQDWLVQQDTLHTAMDFLNFTKYPPSLDFLLLTLGIGFLLLAWFERADTGWSRVLRVFGSAPMFFYVVHLYVLLIAYLMFVRLLGDESREYLGFDQLWQVWLTAGVLAVTLYFPTRWFRDYKRKSPLEILKYF